MQRTLFVSLLVSFLAASTIAAEFDFVASSFLGEAGFNDSVVGACIQEDGTIVLAGNFGPAVREKLGATGDNQGCVVFLPIDGSKLLSAASVASEVNDLAIDSEGNLYLAAGADGLSNSRPMARRRSGKRRPATSLASTQVKMGRLLASSSGPSISSVPTVSHSAQQKGDSTPATCASIVLQKR